MCDFEKASRNAFRSVFTNITIVGYWFHFAKAIQDKLQKIGLGKVYTTNKAFKKWVLKLMSLPFPPKEGISSTYFAIQKSFICLTLTELELVKSFEKTIIKLGLMPALVYSFFAMNLALKIMRNLITSQ